MTILELCDMLSAARLRAEYMRSAIVFFTEPFINSTSPKLLGANIAEQSRAYTAMACLLSDLAWDCVDFIDGLIDSIDPSKKTMEKRKVANPDESRTV